MEKTIWSIRYVFTIFNTVVFGAVFLSRTKPTYLNFFLPELLTVPSLTTLNRWDGTNADCQHRPHSMRMGWDKPLTVPLNTTP